MNQIERIMARADEYAESGGWLERDYLRAAIEQALTQREQLTIKPPNAEGSTNCTIRWMVETQAGWVGSWDRKALEQFTDPKPQLNLNCKSVQKRLATQWGFVPKAEQVPVAWAMPRKDGLLLDIITPEEHERCEGEYTVPLYAAPYSQREPIEQRPPNCGTSFCSCIECPYAESHRNNTIIDSQDK